MASTPSPSSTALSSSLASSPSSLLSSLSSSLSSIFTNTRAASTLVVLALPMLGFLSRQSQILRYYLRLTVYLTGLATCSVWGVIISIIYKVLGKSKDVNWVVARSFHGLVAPLVGVKFKIEGEEILSLPENKPAVLVGNHQTMIDILYLGRIFPKGASIMAKKELKFTPFLGQYMTFSDAVFVNRSKRADAVRVFGEVAKVMKSKVLSLFIFPEGTRSASQTPTLLPFKKGAFHLAVQAKLPIVPIVCENYAHVYSAKSKRFEAGEVTIRVLPPIPTTTLSDPPTSEEITALTEKTRTLMLEALEEMTAGRLAREGKAAKAAAAVEGGEEQDGSEQTPLLSQAQS